MVQPRFKKYTEKEVRKKEGKSPSAPRLKAILTTILVIAIFGIVGYGLASKAPIKNSLSGVYTAPASLAGITPFSRARWSLLDGQAAELGDDLAWYHRSETSPAATVKQLDESGFRPFVFVDEAGQPVDVLDAGPVKAPFGYALLPAQGTVGGYLKHGSMENISLLGKKWQEAKDEDVRIDPVVETRLHGQFLPDTPQFSEEYVCYLADTWDTAVAQFVSIYHRPPSSLKDLLDNLGLKPNPAFTWPLTGKDGGVGVEGGVIDGNIIYWSVTLTGGATRGQARYYDTYSTAWDDPATPANIAPRDGPPSPVVDPGLIDGQKVVMFDIGVLKALFAPPPAPPKTKG